MKKGFFITLEGLEGAGKSTQMQLLKDHLVQVGWQVVCTREPGGTYIGDEIRDILLDPDNSDLDYRVEALLYAASRAQLVSKTIMPALNEGKIVICDRFIDSSLAYQCYGRGLPLDVVLEFNKWATEAIKPNLTILLDIDVEEGLKRATTTQADRIEQEDLSFHQRVEHGYTELAKQYSNRYFIVNANQESTDIHHQITQKVDTLLSKIEVA
ncbi:MAG: dTMP kinase [Actinobacteria bacterium]|nr:MAG: dTMP kinase [Actinomycetota bacterium]